MFRACLFVFLIAGAIGEPESFEGHKVIRVTPQTAEELTFLHDVFRDTRTADVWRPPTAVNGSVILRLSPMNYDDFILELRHAGLRPKVLIEDVQRLIDIQMASYKRLKFESKFSEFAYSKYHTLDEIYAWMENITNVYKDRASLFNVTNSYEGRPLMGIKISTSAKADKQGFWIEGGIHAREWISPATVIFMAGQMLDEYEHVPEITAMVDQFDWYILPVTNPDGYVYTWEQNRLWRKTRSPQAQGCFGVDPNRNWDFEWCKVGSSTDPCSDTYCGPEAFSEIEIKGVANFIQSRGNMKAFIDFHSFSQMWMSPWAFTTEFPPDYNRQNKGSVVAVEALTQVYGTKYENGALATILYAASGSSMDWAYGGADITFSYGVELRDKGEYGFLLPDDEIIPSGKETLQALIALANYVYNEPKNN